MDHDWEDVCAPITGFIGLLIPPTYFTFSKDPLPSLPTICLYSVAGSMIGSLTVYHPRIVLPAIAIISLPYLVRGYVNQKGQNK